jgi:7-cyano-7-deazaguanine synthase
LAKDLAIVLNNGSINSAVITALAAQRYRVIMIYAETATHNSMSRTAYEQQVSHFRPQREHTLPMSYLATINSNQAQTLMSDPRHSAIIAQQCLELLPLVATAARFATHYQAACVYVGLRVGLHADDLAQATEYIQVWNEMLQLPCGQTEIEISAPLLELEPWQVVDTGFQVNVPFERTCSCQEPVKDPCWICRGCRAREAAFQQAAKSDPLKLLRKM